MKKIGLRKQAPQSPALADSHPYLPTSALTQSVQVLYINFVRYFGTSIRHELLSLTWLWKSQDSGQDVVSPWTPTSVTQELSASDHFLSWQRRHV